LVPRNMVPTARFGNPVSGRSGRKMAVWGQPRTEGLDADI
jgi:hypothetical protein